MFNRFLLYLFFLPISMIHAMETASSNPMQTLSDDLIVYNIGRRLDRIERNIFRLTDKKYSQIILTQKQLNDHYIEACKINNTHLMLEWRKQGALDRLEEICNLAIDKRRNRNILAEKLCFNCPKPMTTMTVLLYGIRQNNLPFVSWVLKAANPKHYSQEIRESLDLSQKLNHDTINVYLQNYVSEKEYDARRATEQTASRGYWPPYGPPAP